MAWTTPRTWTDGELVTASIMNTHVRDNFNATGPHLIVRKTSDESTSGSTYQDDDSLVLPISANEVWLVRIHFLVVAGSAVDWNLRWNAPSGANLSGTVVGASGATPLARNQSATSFPTGGGTFDTQGTLVDSFVFDGVIVNGGTGGNLTPQWSNSGAGTATVKANSTLWAIKLA